MHGHKGENFNTGISSAFNNGFVKLILCFQCVFNELCVEEPWASQELCEQGKDCSNAPQNSHPNNSWGQCTM